MHHPSFQSRKMNIFARGQIPIPKCLQRWAHASQPTNTNPIKFEEPSTNIDVTEVDNVGQFSAFRRGVLAGRWDYVLPAYKNNSDFHKIKIMESGGTALHVAVNDGKVELVDSLVSAILDHEGREVLRCNSALKAANEGGDTPLHLAASRGFFSMCKFIIGEHGERKDLIKVKNNKGETPLFRAVLTCHKKTFVYLHHVSKDLEVPLRNNDGETILHRAIWGESLDMAIIITHCYPKLLDNRNKDGATPLKVLANKPSAFKSGTGLPWWKQILYYCILVEPLIAEKAIKSYLKHVNKPEDYEHKVTIQVEDEANKTRTIVLPNFVTLVLFVKKAVGLMVSFSGLDDTLKDLKEIKKVKQKHRWSRQLLDVFMEAPYESYVGTIGGEPPSEKNEEENASQPFITLQQLKILDEDVMKDRSKQETQENKKTESLSKEGRFIDKKETALLAAAKNGIVEIVFDLLFKIPNVVPETNSNNENVLHVAVRNRQSNVVELLRKNLDKELFDSLIFEVDNRENTVLHLAADTMSKNKRTWQIAGAAMHMMWDIKWYQYIRFLVPEHYGFRTNEDEKTAWEIFEKKHKDLVKESSEWLKETSNSCSVVAALIAGVSFATSSSVPGGTDKGKPELEGQPAFDAFAIASLVGLCFSVTALIMFLTILTSRKQAQDFRKSLPLKLLFGLSSLFVSIASLFVSFCTAHFFVLKDKYKTVLFPVYIATSLPVAFYAMEQFPLYADLVKAIFKKVPLPRRKGVQL